MAEGGSELVTQQRGRFCRRLLWNGAESAVKEDTLFRCATRALLFLWSCLPLFPLLGVAALTRYYAFQSPRRSASSS